MSQAAMANKQECLLDQEKLTPENTVDIIRSRMYHLLSQAFSFPDKNLQSTASELWEIAATLYPELGIDQEKLKSDLQIMEPEYINVFDGHEQKKYCKPYEGQWMEAERAKRQWEVKKFYQFFGLGLNRQTNEMPDHIMYELEFMHFLSFKMIEAVNNENRQSDINQAEHYLQAQKDFLQRHLSVWVAQFAERLEEKTELPFYIILAKLTAKFVSDDLAWVEDRLQS